MDLRLDAGSLTRGRWLAVVVLRPRGSGFPRSRPPSGDSGCRTGGTRGNFKFQSSKAVRGPKAPVCSGTALLGQSVAAGPVLVSLGTLYYGFRSRGLTERILSRGT